MRAAVLVSPRSIRVSDLQKPTPKPEEILIRVKSTALCGTDVGIYEGHYGVSYPRIIGHESTGVIEGVGSAVREFSADDRVAINPVFFCNRCRNCAEGRQNMCLNGGLLGREKDGTMAEYISLPPSLLGKLPANIGYEEGTLIQLLSTVVHGFTKVPSVSGKNVVILGQGASGLLFTRLCKISGASEIVTVSRTEWKLDLSRKTGASAAVNAARENVEEAVRARLSGGADIVVESAGSPETISQALELVGSGGTVLLFGVLPERRVGFSTFPLYYKEVNLVASRAATAGDFDRSLELVEKEQIDLKPFVTKLFSLDAIGEVLEILSKRSEQALRFVVTL